MGKNISKYFCTHDCFCCSENEYVAEAWGAQVPFWDHWAVGYRTMACRRKDRQKKDCVQITRDGRTAEFVEPFGTVYAGSAAQLNLGDRPKMTIRIEKIGERGLHIGFMEGPARQPRDRSPQSVFHYKVDLAKFLEEGDEVTMTVEPNGWAHHNLIYTCPRWPAPIVVKTKVWTPSVMARVEGSVGTKVTIMDGPSINGVSTILGKTEPQMRAGYKGTIGLAPTTDYNERASFDDNFAAMMLGAPEKKKLEMKTDEAPAMTSVSSSAMTSLNSTGAGGLDAMIEALLGGHSVDVKTDSLKKLASKTASKTNSLAPISEDSSDEKMATGTVVKPVAKTALPTNKKTPKSAQAMPSLLASTVAGLTKAPKQSPLMADLVPKVLSSKKPVTLNNMDSSSSEDLTSKVRKTKKGKKKMSDLLSGF